MRYLVLMLLVCSGLLVLGQNDPLSSIKPGTNPANSILGLQPSNILQPKTYDALELALFSNAFDGNNLIIPNDFSLEFSPYWFKNHSLPLEKYLNPDHPFDGVWRSSSFSIASTQNFLLQDSTQTEAIAFGYRTSLFFGNKKDESKINTYLQNIDDLMEDRISFIAKMELIDENLDLQKLIEIVLTIENGGIISDGELKEIVKENYSLYQNDFDSFKDVIYNEIYALKKNKLILNEFESYIQKRFGLSVDLAYATIINFPSNQFDFSFIPRHSYWITPSFRFRNKLDFIQLFGVLRYEWFDDTFYNRYFPDSEIFQENIDYGASINMEFNKIAVQFELLGRSSESEIPVGEDNNGNTLYRKENNSDSQYLGSISYNISKKLILTCTLGKRFDSPLMTSNNLVSLLGVNFGLGMWEL